MASGTATARRDWNAAWKAARERTLRRGGKDRWDRRAPSFARTAGKSAFAERMLEIVGAEPGWTVLDVGSGPGTLAIPLARRSCRVTAVDFSPRMLELLRARCAEEGIAGVTAICGSWEDDWDRLGIGRYDVAVASRSLAVDDLEGALEKLDRAARRRVVVAAPTGDGPIDRRLFEAVGRVLVPGPDYSYPLNMLLDRGVSPRVDFIPVTESRRYEGLEDAQESLLWMLPDATPAETERLRAWLGSALVAGEDGGWRLAPRAVRWAVLSWNKEDAPGGRT